MKTILPVLTSAAIVLLAGPALAGQSTPKEIEITKQLNLEQAQQAKNTNQQIAANMPSTDTQAQSAPAAAPSTPAEAAPAQNENENSKPAETSAGPANQPAQ